MANMSTSDLMNYVTLGASAVLIPSQKSQFENTENSGTSTTVLVFLIILLVLYIYCSLAATYKLTHSWLQVILCFFFGFLYMSIAYMYYGLAGYKIVR